MKAAPLGSYFFFVSNKACFGEKKKKKGANERSE
jgi:hypothetical protein